MPSLLPPFQEGGIFVSGGDTAKPHKPVGA